VAILPGFHNFLYCEKLEVGHGQSLGLQQQVIAASGSHGLMSNEWLLKWRIWPWTAIALMTIARTFLRLRTFGRTVAQREKARIRENYSDVLPLSGNSTFLSRCGMVAGSPPGRSPTLDGIPAGLVLRVLLLRWCRDPRFGTL
jgi:hypothetical protein